MFNLMFNLMKQYKSTQSESPCSAESFTAQRRKDYVNDYSEITASPRLHQTVSVAVLTFTQQVNEGVMKCCVMTNADILQRVCARSLTADMYGGFTNVCLKSFYLIG